MTEPGTELKIWAAGVFDGEGCVVIQRIYDYYYKVSVNIGNTNPRIVEPFCEHWGAKLYIDGHYQGIPSVAYYAYFSPSEAPAFLSDILEYLRTKKGAAELVLKALRAVAEAHSGNHPLEPYFWEGVKKGYWGTKMPGYDTEPEAERVASAGRLALVARAHPINRHLKVLDKKTGIMYKTRRQCGEALAHEYKLPISARVWDKIYTRDPNRFSLYSISI